MTSLRHDCLPAVERSHRFIVAAILVVMCLVVRVANASPTTDADALIEQGVKLRVQGKNAEALDLFKKAHSLAPSARTIAQVGLAEGALRQWIEAEDDLVAALAAHDSPWIENPRNRDALDHALTAIRGHIGHVTIIGPAGAELRVNGRPDGRLPLSEPLRLIKGSAQIEAKAAGRRPAETRIDVTGGSTVAITIDLPALPPPPVAVAPAAPAAGALVNVDTMPRSRAKAWAGASLLAVSAAAIATGIVWVAVDGHPSCSAPSGTVCQHLYDTKTQGWITIAAGAAAGVGGGLLIWSSRARHARVCLGPFVLRLAAEF